jgi:hypothetical protein
LYVVNAVTRVTRSNWTSVCRRPRPKVFVDKNVGTTYLEHFPNRFVYKFKIVSLFWAVQA